MARTTLDLDEVLSIREAYEPKVEKSSKLMEIKLEESKTLYDNLKEKVEDFFESKYSVSNVQTYVDKSSSQLESLRLVHTAISKCQENLAYYRIYVYPTLTDFFSQVKTLNDSFYVRFLNDDDVAVTFSSQKAKESEANYVMLDMDAKYQEMKALVDKSESLGKFLDDQMYLLNRIETMIRSIEDMRGNEMFSDGSNNNGMDIVNELDGMDNDDEIIEDEVPSKKEKDKKSGSYEKELDDVLDDDEILDDD